MDKKSDVSRSSKRQVLLVLGSCCVVISAAAILTLELSVVAALLIGTYVGLLI